MRVQTRRACVRKRTVHMKKKTNQGLRGGLPWKGFASAPSGRAEHPYLANSFIFQHLVLPLEQVDLEIALHRCQTRESSICPLNSPELIFTIPGYTSENCSPTNPLFREGVMTARYRGFFLHICTKEPPRGCRCVHFRCAAIGSEHLGKGSV